MHISRSCLWLLLAALGVGLGGCRQVLGPEPTELVADAASPVDAALSVDAAPVDAAPQRYRVHLAAAGGV